ncbi:MAG: flagellar hook basal-body protein [Oscillibacter sp.]|nr:flagellar hook basal-body protein [Oscillibacter sp.]
MNQSFFTGAVAAHQQLKRLTVYGNNIANLNTYGFKAERARFAALMYDDVKNADEEMLPVGVGTCLWTTDTNFNPGPVAETGRKQDYLIEGDGFFALVDLQTNEVSLTRSGAFTIAELLRPTGEVDAEGQPVEERIMYLADGDGRFVLSETGGMIEVDDFNAQYPVGIFDYINYNGMTQLNDTRFTPVDKNGGLRRGSGVLRQGMLEMSNADYAEEVSKVIETQRAYGMALKMVQASDEIETTINSLRN